VRKNGMSSGNTKLISISGIYEVYWCCSCTWSQMTQLMAVTIGQDVAEQNVTLLRC
jgi:hypothetical protein